MAKFDSMPSLVNSRRPMTTPALCTKDESVAPTVDFGCQPFRLAYEAQIGFKKVDVRTCRRAPHFRFGDAPFFGVPSNDQDVTTNTSESNRDFFPDAIGFPSHERCLVHDECEINAPLWQWGLSFVRPAASLRWRSRARWKSAPQDSRRY